MLIFAILLLSLTIRWQKESICLLFTLCGKTASSFCANGSGGDAAQGFFVQPVYPSRPQFNAVRDCGITCGWHSAGYYGVTGNSLAKRLKNHRVGGHCADRLEARNSGLSFVLCCCIAVALCSESRIEYCL